jgi:hypothetical protein
VSTARIGNATRARGKSAATRKPRKGSAHSRRVVLMQRLLRNVRVDERTGCWLWTGRINNGGYPTLTMRLPGREHPVPIFAHRLSLEVFKPNRKPKEDEEAAHAIDCPFPHCVCPDHLRWASREQNEADKRHPRRLKVRELYPPTHFGLAD